MRAASPRRYWIERREDAGVPLRFACTAFKVAASRRATWDRTRVISRQCPGRRSAPWRRSRGAGCRRKASFESWCRPFYGASCPRSKGEYKEGCIRRSIPGRVARRTPVSLDRMTAVSLETRLPELTGWLEVNAAYFAAYMLNAQHAANIKGPVLEIGVFAGKFLMLLHYLGRRHGNVTASIF